MLSDLSGHSSSAAPASQSIPSEILQVLEDHFRGKNQVNRMPDASREAFRITRYENMLRIATVLGTEQPLETPPARVMIEALAKACKAHPEIAALNDGKWSTILYLNTNLFGPKSNHIDALKTVLQRQIDRARPDSIKEVRQRAYDLINFDCFGAIDTEQMKQEWLKPQNRKELEGLISNFRNRKGIAEEIEIPEDITPVQSTALAPISAPTASPQSLAEALLPKIDRAAAQIAIQVGGGLLFANAVDGQQVVITNQNGEVSLTIKNK